MSLNLITAKTVISDSSDVSDVSDASDVSDSSDSSVNSDVSDSSINSEQTEMHWKESQKFNRELTI